MINPKLKDTWRRLRNLNYAFRVGDLEMLVCRLCDAYVEEAWQRRKAEHQIDCVRCYTADTNFTCNRADFTNAQWRDELLSELENGNEPHRD